MSEQFTKEQLSDIVLWYADEYSSEDCPHTTEDDWCKLNVKLIENGDDVVDYKRVYRSDIYEVEGIYFEVTFSRDNSGYWSDGERYDPTIAEVFPKQVTKTIWVNTKPE